MKPQHSRAGLGRSLGGELPDARRLGPEEQETGEERRRIQREPDDDPVVAEAVEVRLDHEQDPAHEREQRRRDEDAVRDPLDVLAERREARRIARHRCANAEELHHQPAADPDDSHGDVHEEQEGVPGHSGALRSL